MKKKTATKTTTLLVTVLAVVLGASIPAAAQSVGGAEPEAGSAPAGAIQYGNSSDCEVDGATPFGHVPGEFLVLYYTGEFRTLRFEEIAGIVDPCERLAAVFARVCVVGLVSGPVDVALLSLRRRKTDPARFGRVLAISMSLNVAGFPMGSAASGPLLEVSLALGLVFAAACAIAGLLTFVTLR